VSHASRPTGYQHSCVFSLQLPAKTRFVNVTASGKGFALVQVSYQYNLNVTGAWPLFTLDPQVDKNSNANHLQLSVCSGYVDPTFEFHVLLTYYLQSHCMPLAGTS